MEEMGNSAGVNFLLGGGYLRETGFDHSDLLQG